MKMKLLSVVGFSGCGKGVFCRIAQDEFGVTWLSSGKVVRDEIAKRGICSTPDNVRQVSDEIRQRHRGYFLAAMDAQIFSAIDEGKNAVIDALREPNDVSYLRQLLCQTKIIAITANAPERLARINTRRRAGDPLSAEQFDTLHRTEIRLGVETVMKSADYVLCNEGSEHEFGTNCRDLLGRLLR